MMFRQSNEELDLAGLDDFIEKPSQNCKEEEIKVGVDKIVNVLDKNPHAIMTIIASHPYISATFLLADLAEKMKKQNCLEKLGILFDKCPDDLVDACVYNSHDLERCIQSMPGYSEIIMQNIFSKENCIKRIFEGDDSPIETLNELTEKYPDFKDKFTACYNRYYNTGLECK